MEKNKLFLVLIIIFALFLRFLWLGRIPIAISGDELDYVLDAKSIFLSGKDLTGKWTPLSLTPAPHTIPKAELPSLLISPLIGPFGLSLFNSRLPYVIFGIGMLLTFYLIARRFFGNEAALIIALVMAINPWSIYFSRTSFEAPLAVFFYYLALYILISFPGWKIILAYPFLFLAFFSYIGTKLIFIPFVFFICFFSWAIINKKKYTKQYLILGLLCLCLFVWYLYSLNLTKNNRVGELITPFHHSVAQRVDGERHLSVDNFLIPLFSNKLVVFTKIFLEKYLGIFSADFLFLHGEARAPFSVWSHGMFYYLDFVFLLLGFCYLFTYDRRIWLLFLALIMISIFPAAMSTVGVEYTLRAVLLYPIFVLFIGLGIWFLINLKKEKRYKVAVGSFLFITYFLQLTNFLTIYFFRNPIYNSEGFGFSQRILVNYVNRVKGEVDRVIIVGGDKLGMLKNYLFYSNILSRKNLPLVRQIIASDDFHWDNVYFFSECPQNLILNKNQIVILQLGAECFPGSKTSQRLSISQLSDGGEISKIINDTVCRRFSLNRYPTGIKFNDFNVEKLSLEEFCQKFISDTTGYAQSKN